MVKIIMDKEKEVKKTTPEIHQDFVSDVKAAIGTLKSEMAERNASVEELDSYIYGKKLQQMLDIPIGHDITPVNWIKRAVEIHRDQFMGRGFNITSTYNTKDLSGVTDPAETNRLKLENKKSKESAEQRKILIDAIIADNGGTSLWQSLAESAGAVGTAAVKTYYDDKAKKYVISPIEAIENVFSIWSSNDFRESEAIGVVYQMDKSKAIREYGIPADSPTSPMGQPLEITQGAQSQSNSQQQMVTFIEGTGFIKGWACDTSGRLKDVAEGKETELNFLIVGEKLVRVLGDPVKMPRFYLLPNATVRRRPWGASDITDAAININLTYIETLSDWRTVASKVNYPKIKAYNFGPESVIPKPEPRSAEFLPLGEGQDLQLLQLGDANAADFKAQLQECKEQFVRETGISRVFFDDPSVELNSNQALMTAVKPTTDKAESKKTIWGPKIIRLFQDAIETLKKVDPSVKDITDDEDSWTLKVNWPSALQKEDPLYQQMILNRFNANTMSLQSFLEAQGESKEEMDRLRDEMEDPKTLAILGKSVGLMAQTALMPQPPPAAPGQNPNGGQDIQPQINTQASNQPGTGAVSQPGSGAPAVSPAGANAMVAQNAGQ